MNQQTVVQNKRLKKTEKLFIFFFFSHSFLLRKKVSSIVYSEE